MPRLPNHEAAEVRPAPASRTVSLLTLGCKLNQAETEAMARQLAALGFTVLDRPVAADGYIVNSCAVTHVAERKSRHLVRLAQRLSPGAPVVLTGCYPEAPTGGADHGLPGAAIVVPGREKVRSVASLLGAMGSPSAAGPIAGPRGLRTRAFVKSQEGCNDVCAFCIVPRTRGRERSVPVADVVAAVQEREAAGVQEVVITGTQLGAYGRDVPQHGDLVTLVSALLDETAIPRIRISSVQPQDITHRFLALWDDPRLCRHLHLALQSGCAATLRRMRRRYGAAEYREALAAIRASIPGVAITTDVIAGFPGETEAEFEESYAFCEEAAFAGMHVFPYSPRRGTLAALLPAQVPESLKRERVRRMAALAERLAAQFVCGLTGSTQAVLWEESAAREPGCWTGLTDTYVRVTAPSRLELRNRIVPARIVAAVPGGARGDVSLTVG